MVAIKRVLPHLTTNPQFVAMFLDEARLSLFLQHANVVQVFDIAKAADGTYFLVMEYVDGCDLKALIDHEIKNDRSANLALVLYIMIEAARGCTTRTRSSTPRPASRSASCTATCRRRTSCCRRTAR